jgi:hypothetical protein
MRWRQAILAAALAIGAAYIFYRFGRATLAVALPVYAGVRVLIGVYFQSLYWDQARWIPGECGTHPLYSARRSYQSGVTSNRAIQTVPSRADESQSSQKTRELVETIVDGVDIVDCRLSFIVRRQRRCIRS